MKIEVWSDIYCPFCYLGEQYLKQALAGFAHASDVDIVYRSFELDPSLPKGEPGQVYEYLAAKYQISIDKARQTCAGIQQQGQAVGLTMNMDQAVISNTFDAHRLIQFAQAEGKGQAMVDRLFEAHFRDGLNVGDLDTLVRLATEVGLDEEATRRMLAGQDFAGQVQQDQAEGAQLGVTGVPFVVFDRRFAVHGALPTREFEAALQKAWAERQGAAPIPRPNGQANGHANGIDPSGSADACGPDGCTLH